jgi:hypothetical protein
MKTPVLVIIFKRPEMTRRVLEAVAAVRPPLILVAADGPRGAFEADQCAAARRVLDEIEFPCEVRTNFADANLGCGIRVHTAITWALEQVEEVVILEDDTLPNASFFRFCDELLARYRDDERVMHISGNNFVGAASKTPYSYYFSKYTHASGWATWRRAWRHFDWSVARWPEADAAGLLEATGADAYEARYWREIFERIHKGAPDIWDYQWNFAVWSNSGLAILPSVNLVWNDGWGPDATHTQAPMAWPETRELGEIRHPSFVFRNVAADAYQFDINFGGAALRAMDSPQARLRRKLGPALWPLRKVKRMLEFLGFLGVPRSSSGGSLRGAPRNPEEPRN